MPLTDEEIRENDKNFFYVKFSIFGFTTHWGYIPYSNSTRRGKMVWIREDYERLDII